MTEYERQLVAELGPQAAAARWLEANHQIVKAASEGKIRCYINTKLGNIEIPLSISSEFFSQKIKRRDLGNDLTSDERYWLWMQLIFNEASEEELEEERTSAPPLFTILYNSDDVRRVFPAPA